MCEKRGTPQKKLEVGGDEKQVVKGRDECVPVRVPWKSVADEEVHTCRLLANGKVIRDQKDESGCDRNA